LLYYLRSIVEEENKTFSILNRYIKNISKTFIFFTKCPTRFDFVENILTMERYIGSFKDKLQHCYIQFERINSELFPINGKV